MKAETKKETVKQSRNPWSQSERWVSVSGGKDLLKRYVFNLEWKNAGVMDDKSGNGEGDEREEW